MLVKSLGCNFVDNNGPEFVKEKKMFFIYLFSLRGCGKCST